MHTLAKKGEQLSVNHTRTTVAFALQVSGVKTISSAT
jgi:hypothetical protein